MEQIISYFKNIFSGFAIPSVGVLDIVEMLIIAFVIYHVVIWVKKTRAWMLVKGILVLFIIYIVAFLLDMNVILWVFDKTISIGITALMIVFQPELRNALEELGRKKILSSIFNIESGKIPEGILSDKSINEIVRASTELARAKTGALIVIEKDISLAEFERTGINIDSAISSQLLINIFEHNTPLHDGAIIVRKDRIVSATCYLPLSDNMGLSKELGTRHRAAVGISEVSDSLTVIVSEETGKISIADGGMLLRNVDGDLLKRKLVDFQGKPSEEKTKRHFLLRKNTGKK